MRQGEDNLRASPFFAIHNEIAVHRTGEIAADGEPQSGSMRARCQTAVELHEWLEDRFELVARYPNARVADTNLHLAGRRDGRGRDANLAAGWRELHGVGEQIQDDLLELLDVGEDGEVRVARFECIRELLLLHLRR